MSTLNIAIARWTNHLSETGGFPDCMSKNEFTDWTEAEREAPTKPIREFACRDCTVAYAKACGDRCALKGLNVARIAK